MTFKFEATVTVNVDAKSAIEAERALQKAFTEMKKKTKMTGRLTVDLIEYPGEDGDE